MYALYLLIQLGALIYRRSVSAAVHRFYFTSKMFTMPRFNIGIMFSKTNVVC